MNPRLSARQTGARNIEDKDERKARLRSDEHHVVLTTNTLQVAEDVATMTQGVTLLEAVGQEPECRGNKLCHGRTNSPADVGGEVVQNLRRPRVGRRLAAHWAPELLAQEVGARQVHDARWREQPELLR